MPARLFAALGGLTLTLIALSARAEENWPAFRGPRGDGSTVALKLPLAWSETEHVRWKTPIHDRGWSSPVIWKNQIWMTTARTDGKELFAVAVDATTGQVIHDIKVFDVADPHGVHALNSYASPTPVVEEGRVYVHFGCYGTACLDMATEGKLWERRDLTCDHLRGPGSSPIVVGDLIILHFDGTDVQFAAALDKQTGETRWRRDRDVDFGTTEGDFMKAYCTPIVIEVGGRSQLISPCAKAVLAYDPATGLELWRVRHPGFSLAGRPLYSDGLLYVNTGTPPELWAIRSDGSGDVTDTHVAWKMTKQIGARSSPVIHAGLIYGVSDGGIARCLDGKTGEEHWSHRLEGAYSASPILADERIYYFNQDGKTTVIKTGRAYEELATSQLEDGFMASAAVQGEAFILRTRSALYRIEE